MTNHKWRKYQHNKLSKYFKAYKCSKCGLYKVRFLDDVHREPFNEPDTLVENVSFEGGGILFDEVKDQEIGCDEYIVQSIIK